MTNIAQESERRPISARNYCPDAFGFRAGGQKSSYGLLISDPHCVAGAMNPSSRYLQCCHIEL